MRINRIVSSFLNAVTGARHSCPVGIVAKRFIKAFEDHGIEPNQIPRLLPNVPFSALLFESALLEFITPEVLDQVAQLFGIRAEWLEGVDDRIYEYQAYYKEPEILLKHLAAIVVVKKVQLTFPLRILTTDKWLDRGKGHCGYMIPVLVEKIIDIGEEPAYRYHVYQDGVDWSHLPARIELKAIARIVRKKLGVVIPLHVITDKEMNEVLEGRLIPHKLLNGCQITNPSLEDFVMTADESMVAKEVDELPDVLAYIQEHKLENIKFELASNGDSAEVKQSELPPINFVTDKPVPLDLPYAAKPVAPDWAIQARAIADELDARNAANGAHDSLRSMAGRVAKIMREQKIYGPRGPLTEATILREALQGGRWKRKQ